MNKRDKKKKRKLEWKRKRRFPLETVKEKITNKACAECQACCMAVGVHELNKPMWSRCEHQCEVGCGIYENRPQSCKDYYCLWQAGILKHEENRPDKLGVIFDFRSEGSIDTISAWELWEGAVDQAKVIKIIEIILQQLGGKVVILIRRFNSSKCRIVGHKKYLKDLVIKENYD